MDVKVGDNTHKNEQSKGQTKSKNTITVEKRYGALRLISLMYLIFAWIALILSLILSFTFLRLIFILLPSGIVTFITFLAISQLIHVVIDIEENTRKASLSKE